MLNPQTSPAGWLLYSTFQQYGNSKCFGYDINALRQVIKEPGENIKRHITLIQEEWNK